MNLLSLFMAGYASKNPLIRYVKTLQFPRVTLYVCASARA